MAQSTDDLTTNQFSEMAGLPVSRVTKMIRAGKIKAQKQSGRWMIPRDQLNTLSSDAPEPAASKPKKSPATRSPQKKSPAPSAAQPASQAKKPSKPGKMLNISDFAAMTYLTEYGVTLWLKTGRLSGRQDEKGGWMVDSANLEDPTIKRLLR